MYNPKTRRVPIFVKEENANGRNIANVRIVEVFFENLNSNR